MRIAIMGAGGVGGYFGAALARAGEDVTFIARGPHLGAMQAHGLTIAGDDETFTLKPVRALGETTAAGAMDVVLFCVKLYDTDPAATACRSLIGPKTIVITLQNGVESVGRLAALLGPGKVYGGAVYIVANIERPGVIRRTGRSDLMVLGAPPGAERRALQVFAERGRAAGLNIELAADMEVMLWTKFVLLAASSSMTALTRQTVGVVRNDPDLRAVMIAAIGEAVAVARARGIALADDIETATLAQLDQVVGAGAKASQLTDLERGRPLELEWLSGAIHRLGAAAGVATPVHSTVYAALKPFAGGQPR